MPQCTIWRKIFRTHEVSRNGNSFNWIAWKMIMESNASYFHPTLSNFRWNAFVKESRKSHLLLECLLVSGCSMPLMTELTMGFWFGTHRLSPRMYLAQHLNWPRLLYLTFYRKMCCFLRNHYPYGWYFFLDKIHENTCFFFSWSNFPKLAILSMFCASGYYSKRFLSKVWERDCQGLRNIHPSNFMYVD